MANHFNILFIFFSDGLKIILILFTCTVSFKVKRDKKEPVFFIPFAILRSG